MLWLDIAIARRKDAERAFFESDDDADDGIPRLQLAGLSDFELAHLGMLLTGAYEPALVLDGDAPDEIVTAMDPRLVDALAAEDAARLPALAARWQAASGHPEALLPALTELHDFACRARADGLALLYAQGSDLPEDGFDD
jgi:hypothetical protein